ncbi:hypothetical protein HYW82_00460 [Candidatus Peregrinibacteria bacterium]|nr:hypothetical protein [Candidatus Peregrinibacteria bacterium]
METQRYERRRPESDKITGLTQRVVREGVSADQLAYRETDSREENVIAVKARLLELAGYTTERVMNELAPVNPTNSSDLSPENAELLADLESQYPIMQATLERYEIPLDGMPTWQQIKQGLTPEVLAKASKLEEPTILLVSPVSRQSKVEAIDNHKVPGQKYDTAIYNMHDDNLWNGGKNSPENKWKVLIVEGTQNVQKDPAINNGSKTNFQMTKAWLKKLKNQGLKALEGADAYLTLMMRSLVAGKPVDKDFFTVLNAENLTESSLVAYGVWDYARVRLGSASPADINARLRLRGSVGVDVPQI